VSHLQQGYLKLIFKSSLLPYAFLIQVHCESVYNSSGLLEEGPKCYAVGLQTSECNADVAPALWTATLPTPSVTEIYALHIRFVHRRNW